MVTTMTIDVARYGAVELKRVRWKYQFLGLALSILIHGLIIGSYYAAVFLTEEEPPTVRVRLVDYTKLGPPPSIAEQTLPPNIAVASAITKPSIGTPVPVPDAEVNPEQTIASQAEMSRVPAAVLEGGAEGAEVRVTPDITIPFEEEPPADFVPVEKEPIIVRGVKPAYPDLALRAGLEGTVYVKIWVDREGKPKKAVVLKSSSEVFNQPTIDAAMRFLFTPAVMNNGPVSVWVAVPFKFTITKKD